MPAKKLPAHLQSAARASYRRSVRRKKNVGTLTKNQAIQVKTLLKEEKVFKDVYHQMTDLTTTLASIQPDGDAAGPFFTLDGEAHVAGAAVDVEAERDGNSVSPVSLDLRCSVNFASPQRS